jgi:hypothetical protein
MILAALRPQDAPRPAASQVDVCYNIDASPSTLRFLAGADANGPGWNDRLFRASCDLAGRNVPQELAETLLLKGAQPWNPAEEEKARATILSAFSQARAPGVH